MRSSTLSRVALSFVAGLLTGCGGSQPPISAPGVMPLFSQMRSDAATSATPQVVASRSLGYKATAPLLFVTNIGNFSVTVYRARANNPAPLATITDGIANPIGACTDGQGTLYVVNEPGSGWVSEYPPGKTTPSTTITKGMNTPAYCALDGKGNLWVTNVYGPNVTEYLRGSKQPHTVITKGLVFPVGIAIDRSGSLYVGNFGPSASNVQNVVVYAPGSKSPSRTITNGITSPRGLAVDSNGNLYVPNIYQNTVAEYRSGQDHPFQTITKAMDHPEAVTVDKKGKLYVDNLGNSTIVEFAHGSLTPQNREISKGLDGPNGVSYYPAWLP